jgi:hypothetical protein
VDDESVVWRLLWGAARSVKRGLVVAEHTYRVLEFVTNEH